MLLKEVRLVLSVSILDLLDLFVSIFPFTYSSKILFKGHTVNHLEARLLKQINVLLKLTILNVFFA